MVKTAAICNEENRNNAIIPISHGNYKIEINTEYSEYIIRSSALSTLKHLNLSDLSIEISVYMTNDEEIQSINKAYRKKDSPTNIISFSYNSVNKEIYDTQYPGELIISVETLDKESKDFGITFEKHLAHMVIHGVLHIFGFDHKTDQEEEEMRLAEKEILQSLNFITSDDQ